MKEQTALKQVERDLDRTGEWYDLPAAGSPGRGDAEDKAELGKGGRPLTSAGEPGVATQRVTYVDWLRIIAVLLLIPFHSARIFDTVDSFYVKNEPLSMAATAFVGFVTSWHMPLLFLLAGAASWFALGRRSPAQYIHERGMRLVIPLLFGVLVVVPPQMYFAQLFHGNYAGSYLDFYPGFFQMVSGSDYPGIGFSFAHLWFILFLFPMSIIALPIFVLLRRKLGMRLTAGIAASLAKPGAILLLALPLPFTTLLEDPMGHNFGLYIILFVYGYLLMSNARFQESLYRSRWVAMVLAIVVTLGYFALVLIWNAPGEDVSLTTVLFQFSFHFAAWFWIVAILGFGQKYLTAKNAVLRYANESVYPVYILHQTVIIAIGYYVVQLQADVWVKFLIIAVCALVATFGIYDLVIRRLGVMRFLFGMKQQARPAEPKAAPQTGESAA